MRERRKERERGREGGERGREKIHLQSKQTIDKVKVIAVK